MRYSVDTHVLSKYNLSIENFLTMLFPYFEISYSKAMADTIAKELADKNLYEEQELVLSNNSKNLVAKVLIESSEKLDQSLIKDFEALANILMDLFPKGNKPGTTYPWRGTKEEVAQKLRTLVVKHNFYFTEKEAVDATMEYIHNFTEDTSHMKLLKYFILKTKDKEISSDFMTIIENNR